MTSLSDGISEISVIPRIADSVAYKANMIEIDRLLKPSRYRHIVAWGKWLGFKPQVVQRNLGEADDDNAPLDAIQKVDGRWLQISDIQSDANRLRVIELCENDTRGDSK